VKKLLILALLGLLLGACSRATKPSDPLIVIETAPGKEFKVILNSNPTTGYHWELVGELDPKVVEFVSKDYNPDASQAVGSGGVEVWVFKAVAAGETEITLGYYPPSGAEAQPQTTETFKVSVK
jgi:predicted secreted protein